MFAFPTSSLNARWRMPIFMALVILLHLLFIHWGSLQLDAIPTSEHSPNTMRVKLLQLKPPEQPISLPVAKPVKKPVRPPKPRRTTRRVPVTTAVINPPEPPYIATETPSDVAMHTTEATPPENDSDQTPPTTETDTPPSATTTAETNSSAENAPIHGTYYQTDPAPSATLQYDVYAMYNNLPAHGSSTITWETDGKHYHITGKAEDFLFTFLRFNSTGVINEFGVSPEHYDEKPMHKNVTNTEFLRDNKTITFSASSQTYPLTGGEQDRASLIWQLVAIARGDSSKISAGTTIDLFVAGARDAEVWRMQIAGEENIQVPLGQFRAWHIVRLPRTGTDGQRLDIWLAPEQDWYPVKLRYSEANGDWLEMSLSKLKSR